MASNSQGSNTLARTPPGAAYGWSLVLVLLITYILSNVDRNVIALLVTPIKRELMITDTEMSYLIGGGFAIFYVTAAVPLGVLADRANRIRLIIIGVILWSFATAACGLSQTYAALFVARICVGVGEAVLTPCALSIIADALPREKLGRAVAMFAAGTPVGTGVGLIAGGAVINMAQGGTIALPLIGDLAPWRAIFVLLIVPAVFVVLLLACFREPVRRTLRSVDPTASGLREGFRFLHANPGVLYNMIGFAIVATAAQGSFPWLPSFFERSYGVEVQEISFRLGSIAVVCGIAGLMIGGTIGDFLFRRGRLDAHLIVGLVSALLLAPLMLLMAFATSVEMALVCVGLMIVVAQVPPGVATAAIQMATPTRLRGVIASLNLVTAGLASIAVGPSLIAWINDYVVGYEGGLRYSLAIVSLLAPVGALLFHLGRRPYRQRMEEILAAEARETL